MSKLLLTGATGYLGSHILQQLLTSPMAVTRNLKIVATTTGRNPQKLKDLQDIVIKSLENKARVNLEVVGVGS